MEKWERLQLLKELILCNQQMYYWCFDKDLNLLNPEENNPSVLNPLFTKSGLAEYATSQDWDGPVIVSIGYNLCYIAVVEDTDDDDFRIHVLGPSFFVEISPQQMDNLIHVIRFTSAGRNWKQRLIDALSALPVISIDVYTQYAVMLYYCVTQKRIDISNIHYVTTAKLDAVNPEQPRDRMMVYLTERQMLQVVRDGDIGNLTSYKHASQVSKPQAYVTDTVKQAQISSTIFTSLCTRTAIEGGLSAEEAYSLGDKYIQSIHLVSSHTELAGLNRQMYQDFVTRVHRLRMNPKYSKSVQSCCNYIDLHLEEDLNIEVLADRIGYTKYYLSRRFKAETMCSIADYIKIARIERAKLLLCTTTISIPDIAERLKFCTRGHFSNTFKKFTGNTPAQYRAKTQIL